MKWKQKTILSLFKDSYTSWSKDNISTWSAALSYYTTFSLAPLLLVTISIAGLLFGHKAVQGQVAQQISGLVGDQAAATIQTMLAKTSNTSHNIIGTVIGLVTLLLGAMGVFGNLKSALNHVWGVEEKAGLATTFFQKLISFSMLLVIGFLLGISLELTAVINVIASFAKSWLPVSAVVFEVLNFLVSFAVISVLFTAIHRVLPDVVIPWKKAAVGGVVTALLFTIGKTLIGMYLGHSSLSSTYGAAASLAVLLVWVYYSAQILLFGAEFTKTYVRYSHVKVQPSEYGAFQQKAHLHSPFKPVATFISFFIGGFVERLMGRRYRYGAR